MIALNICEQPIGSRVGKRVTAKTTVRGGGRLDLRLLDDPQYDVARNMINAMQRPVDRYLHTTPGSDAALAALEKWKDAWL